MAGDGLVDRLCRLRLRALEKPDIGAPIRLRDEFPGLDDAANKKQRLPVLINVGAILGKSYPVKVNLENKITLNYMGEWLLPQLKNDVFDLANISTESRTEFTIVLYKTGVHCIVLIIDMDTTVQSIGHFMLEAENLMSIERGTYETLNSTQMMGELKEADDALAVLKEDMAKYKASNSKQTQKAKLDADRERIKQNFENAQRAVKSEASVIYERDIESIKSKIAQETEQINTKLTAELEPVKTKLKDDLEHLAKEFKENQAKLKEEASGAQAKLKEDAARSHDELKATYKPQMDESVAIYKQKLDAPRAGLNQQLQDLEAEAATRQAAIASNTGEMQAEEAELRAKKLQSTYTKMVRRGSSKSTTKATSKVAKNVPYPGGAFEEVVVELESDDEGRPATSSPEAGSGSSNDPVDLDDE